jgi:hypothetical protein
VDIVITRDDFQTLVDVVIANSTHTYLVQRALTMTMQASICLLLACCKIRAEIEYQKFSSTHLFSSLT